MSDLPSHEPLIPDLKRQAHDTIRAFDFQLWHTVLAWLELPRESLLVVEGAEDFDILRSHGSETVQVKAGKTPLTINSLDVIQAIQNFWNTCLNNPGQEIQYRFLTQAGIGTESERKKQGKGPLLTAWSEVALKRAAVGDIREHLGTNKQFSPELAEFIKNASDDDLIDRLICKIEWDVRNQDTRGLIRSIEDSLVLLGENHSVPPSWAKEARHKLYSIVAAAASDRKHSPLTRVQLLEAFELATTPRRTPAEEILLQRRVMEVAGNSTNDGCQPSPLTINEQKLTPPPLRNNIVSRSLLVADVREKLQLLKCVFLVGSTGMGKTTLANLVVHLNGKDWLWWTGRDLEPPAVRIGLERISREIKKGRFEGVVIDDLSFLPSHIQKFEEELEWLFFESEAANSALIVTSQRDPRGLDFFTGRFDQDCVFKMPPMSRDEILELTYDMGCPKRPDVETMASILELATSGHPQLITAQLASLRREKWEVPQVAKLVQLSPDALQKKMNARSLVFELPVSQKEILLRLSMVRCPFNRKHVLSLGASPPKVIDPGLQFDQLVGPWIESLHDDSFRVSPLITQMAEEILSQQDVVNLHSAISITLFSKQMMDHEVEAAFWHAWKAQSMLSLYKITAAISGLRAKDFEQLAPLMRWFCLEKSLGNEQEVLLAKNPNLSLVLRVFQFRLAAPLSDSLARKIFELLEYEASKLNDIELKARILNSAGSIAWITPDAHIPPSKLVCCLSYMTAQDEADEITEDVVATSSIRRTFEELTAKGSWARKAAIFTHTHCKSMADLREWIIALNNAPREALSEWIAAHEEKPADAKQMIDSAWLHESDQSNPNWLGALQTLDEAIVFGIAHGCLSLASSAIDAKAIILDEYLNKRIDALSALDLGEMQFATKQPTLMDRRARILARAGDHEAALILWRITFDHLKDEIEPFNSSRPFGARLAAISAGMLGLHIESAAWFELGCKYIGKFGIKRMLIGLIADAGMAHWKSGKKNTAIEKWFEALCMIERLPKKADDLVGFRIRKCTSHTIAWVFGEVLNSGQNLFEPPIGFCSALDTSDDLKSLPEPDWHQIWVMLLSIATEAELSPDFRFKIESKIDPEQLKQARVFYAMDAIQHALATSNLSSLPQMQFRLVQAVNEAKIEMSKTRPESVARLKINSLDTFNPDDDAAGKAPYIAALIVLAGTGKNPADILPEWRENAKTLPWSAALNEWFDNIEAIFSMNPKNAVAAARGDSPFWAEKTVASLAVICSNKSRAIEIAYAQHPLLVWSARDSAWKRRLGHPLYRFYTAKWNELVKSPALLIQPSVTVPKLKAALESSATGFEKAGDITIAAADAVRLIMPPEVLKQIRDCR